MVRQVEPGAAADERGAFDVVAVATSLGGLLALRAVLSQLPAEFPAAIIVVQHRQGAPHYELSELLRARTKMAVKEAVEGEPLAPGTVYVAPAGEHVTVDAAGALRLDSSERVNFVRPSADVLFASVAAAFGPRAIGVVLTGALNDGAEGVRAIKAARGRVVVQDEASSVAFGMPRAALATGCVDFVLPLECIASALVTLVMVRGAADLFKVPVASWAHMKA